jgi:type I restriction enzyme S subunit
VRLIDTRQAAEDSLPDHGDLPEGWITATLPHVAAINMGQSPPGSSYNDRGEGLPFFQGKADFGQRYPTPRAWCTSPRKMAQTGDVLISVRAPVGPTNVADQTCVIGRGVAALTPLGGIPTEFLLFALRLQEPELALSGTGSTFTAVSKGDLIQIEIAVPPLAEQKRIVAKVEELLARVNAARQRLAHVSAILGRFRQAVLAAAVSGRLTEDWRGNSSGASESAEDPGDLPGGWRWQRAADLYLDARYGTSVKCQASEAAGTPVLRIPNIVTGRVNLTDLKFGALSDREFETLRLLPGDILVCRTNGSLDLVGKAAVVPELPGPHAFASYLIRLRLESKTALPPYFHIFLSSSLGRDKLEERARTTAGQFNLNLLILGDLDIPLPPVQEQREIVRRVEALLGLADAIERRVAAAMLRADRLTQSILAKAFCGELVPTEAELARREGRDYEPASVLLERIQRERGPILDGRKGKR